MSGYHSAFQAFLAAPEEVRKAAGQVEIEAGETLNIRKSSRKRRRRKRYESEGSSSSSQSESVSLCLLCLYLFFSEYFLFEKWCLGDIFCVDFLISECFLYRR